DGAFVDPRAFGDRANGQTAPVPGGQLMRELGTSRDDPVACMSGPLLPERGMVGASFPSRHSGGAYRQPLPAAHSRRTCLHRVVVVDPPRREPLEHLFERDPAFEPRERRAQAEVDAIAESAVPVDLAAYVEAVRVGELALVAVGGAVENGHDAALRHLL